VELCHVCRRLGDLQVHRLVHIAGVVISLILAIRDNCAMSREHNMTTGATNWKPDFTQPNPYADMPAAYADLVSKTFVPTTDNTLSPVQQAAAKAKYLLSMRRRPPRPPHRCPAAKSSVYVADQQTDGQSSVIKMRLRLQLPVKHRRQIRLRLQLHHQFYANADETAPPAAPPAPPASLGTLTDSEQRVWNTIVADQGDKAATQAVINLRATNAGIDAIKSGQAKSVSISPTGDVTTVTATETRIPEKPVLVVPVSILLCRYRK